MDCHWPGVTTLTHWDRVTHICVRKLPIIGSDNGLSPGRRQAIIWTNAGILLIWSLWTNSNEILIEINLFSLKKMRLKMSSEKWWPFCLGLNVLSNGLLPARSRASIEPMLYYHQWDTREPISANFNQYNHFFSLKGYLTILTAKCQPFVQASIGELVFLLPTYKTPDSSDLYYEYLMTKQIVSQFKTRNFTWII